jgi:hypothetical protein
LGRTDRGGYRVLVKFLEGLAFGAGLAIASLVVLSLAPHAVPVRFYPEIPHEVGDGPPLEVRRAVDTFEESGPPFHELPLEQQIAQASVIALVRHEPAPDGRRRAIIREFLKKDPAAEIYYAIGDEYPPGSFYPGENTHHGDGAIVFFVGSPATMRLSMTYSGHRISGLGDLPIELFRRKCETDS